MVGDACRLPPGIDDYSRHWWAESGKPFECRIFDRRSQVFKVCRVYLANRGVARLRQGLRSRAGLPWAIRAMQVRRDVSRQSRAILLEPTAGTFYTDWFHSSGE